MMVAVRRTRPLAIAALAILVLAVIWYKWELRPVDADDQVGMAVQIPSGSSVRSIAAILTDKHLVRSRLTFTLYARIHRVQGEMKAGGFFLRPSMSTPEIITVLRRGFSEASVVTIPEGYTVKDIDRLLSERGLTKPGEVLTCARTCDVSSFAFLPSAAGWATRAGKAEGYLFPDTYFVVQEQMTAQSFLERMLGNFRTRVVKGLADDLKASKRSLTDIVTMASLIEEETRTDEERPLVAGILWKRFDRTIGLQVDAAVRYILEKPKGSITQEDLQLNSPYNLRKYRGLPPGPIANPGLASIKAALHPKDNPYYYYLHGTDGAIHYAVTNDEHNENRRKYLR
ncbi:MAG: UPF0755 protein [Candidatus Peregrinibacteria bacterium Greene0416_19]|nr:MAG: UPF0755 protein [Candidatus Peregrinibacteria bacterium Greene0416_19]